MTTMNFTNMNFSTLDSQGNLPPLSTRVSVTVRSSDNYRLTQDDLSQVFGRFGRLNSVAVSPVDSMQATVEFANLDDALRCVQQLNNHILPESKGYLVVSLMDDFTQTPPVQLPMVMPMPMYEYAQAMPFGFVQQPMAYQQPAYSYQQPQQTFTQQSYQQPMQQRVEQHVQMVRNDKNPIEVRKFTCRFDVGIQNEKGFQVARRIIGAKGANMQRIFRLTQSKLRLRGQGSGFKEGPNNVESPEPLHLCISAQKLDLYEIALVHVRELLSGIYKEYTTWCKQKRLPMPQLRIVCREHPLVTMHRNALKALGGQPPCNMMIVPDDKIPLNTSTTNTPALSPFPSPNRTRANSTESAVSLHDMLADAKRKGDEQEVSKLSQLLLLRSGDVSSKSL